MRKYIALLILASPIFETLNRLNFIVLYLKVVKIIFNKVV